MQPKNRSGLYLVITALNPLIGTFDYCIEYLKKIKNRKPVRNLPDCEIFYKTLSNPHSVTDDEVISILHRIINDYDPYMKESLTNPIFSIFKEYDSRAIQIVSALMLRHTYRKLSIMIVKSAGLKFFEWTYQHDLQQLLKCVFSWFWQPHIMEFRHTDLKFNKRLDSLKNISSVVFQQIREVELPTKRKLDIKIWSIRPQYREWAIEILNTENNHFVPNARHPLTIELYEHFISIAGLHIITYLNELDQD